MESQPQNPEFRIDPENFHPYFPDGRGYDLSLFCDVVICARPTDLD